MKSINQIFYEYLQINNITKKEFYINNKFDRSTLKKLLRQDSDPLMFDTILKFSHILNVNFNDYFEETTFKGRILYQHKSNPKSVEILPDNHLNTEQTQISELSEINDAISKRETIIQKMFDIMHNPLILQEYKIVLYDLQINNYTRLISES